MKLPGDESDVGDAQGGEDEGSVELAARPGTSLSRRAEVPSPGY